MKTKLFLLLLTMLIVFSGCSLQPKEHDWQKQYKTLKVVEHITGEVWENGIMVDTIQITVYKEVEEDNE